MEQRGFVIYILCVYSVSCNVNSVIIDIVQCSVARSCRVALCNICRIRPFLTRDAAQLLVQAFVISLLAGLSACMIKLLQRIQNAAARLVFNLPTFSHVTPLFRDLHWLPVVACIRIRTMVLTYKAVNGIAPTYLQALVKLHTPAQAPHSTTFSWTSGTTITKSK